MSILSANKPTLQACYGGALEDKEDQWLFIISGVKHQDCYLFNHLLKHIVDNYPEIITSLHDEEGGVIINVKA